MTNEKTDIQMLEEVRDSALSCLDELRSGLQLMEPGVMKTTKLNLMLERKDSRDMREKIQDQIAYYKAVIDKTNETIERIKKAKEICYDTIS